MVDSIFDVTRETFNGATFWVNHETRRIHMLRELNK